MKDININRQQGVELLLYPDNQPHVKIPNVIDNYSVICSIKSSLDLMHLLQVSDAIDGVEWQGHDFSQRGRSSIESTFNQAGHLLSFNGTDTIPAVLMLEKYYNANMEKELIGSSVPATEHSVMTSYGKEDEFTAFKRLLEQFPKGILSIVSDSFDLWKVLTEFMPQLKDQIMARDGKLVIRPDSGDPVDIICGKTYTQDLKWLKTEQDIINFYTDIGGSLFEITQDSFQDEYIDTCKLTDGRVFSVIIRARIEKFHDHNDSDHYVYDGIESIKYKEITGTPSDKGVIELLWDVFGGTINKQGYKVLDPHVGAIYGDSITIERAEEICRRNKAKGFATTNIVLGIGSYTFNMNTRDTLGIAVKSTYCEVEIYDNNRRNLTVEKREIFKDPITDDGTKKSARGLLKVDHNEKGEITLYDQVSEEEEKKGLLELVFEDGSLIRDHSLSEIRERIKSQSDGINSKANKTPQIA